MPSGLQILLNRSHEWFGRSSRNSCGEDECCPHPEKSSDICVLSVSAYTGYSGKTRVKSLRLAFP
jgi:hypothetical protein